MKRSVLILALLVLLVLVVVAIPVAADSHVEPHPHMLLQKVEVVVIDDEPHLVGFSGCVDFTNSRSVPVHAHHDQLHFGDSGVSFGGASGHAVIPSGHFPTPDFPLPWANCEEFVEFISGGQVSLLGQSYLVRFRPLDTWFSEAARRIGQALDKAEVARHLRWVCDTAKADGKKPNFR